MGTKKQENEKVIDALKSGRHIENLNIVNTWSDWEKFKFGFFAAWGGALVISIAAFLNWFLDRLT